jgi:hypothetical protein
LIGQILVDFFFLANILFIHFFFFDSLNYKKSRITPRHILLAIKNDEELNDLLHNVVISNGGVLPNIHESLLGKKKKNKKK